VGVIATVALLISPLAFSGIADAAGSPIGAHSMLQLNSPYSFMQAMFAQAAGMHASAIRLDVAPALVFTGQSQPPDFSGLDEVMALSAQYSVPVVADLFTIPWWIADCQVPTDPSGMTRCGTDDLAAYGSLITQIVAHADPVILDWEIWNEPDSAEFFTGTPQQYAQMLRTAHDAIKAIDPQADVLLGGISSTAGMSWLAQVFATPGADAGEAFDIANVHERNRLDALAGDIVSWKRFLGTYDDFTGPLWVTEHGYPSDPAFQYDPSYAAGLPSQAAYLTASIPTLIDAGADEVFVTERDNLVGQFASEGLLGGDVSDPPVADPTAIEKPAYAAVQTLAECYASLGGDCPGPPPVGAPAALTIPATRLRSSSVSSVSVSDPGPGPLALGTASLAGPSPDPILIGVDSCSNQILEPDQTCNLALGFSPTRGGAVTAALQLPSDNGPLMSVPLRATAFALPGIALVRSANRTPCFSPGSRNAVLVLAYQPSSESWHVMRADDALDRHCLSKTGVAPPPGAGGRSSANGHTSTGDHTRYVSGRAGYLARFALPVNAGRRGLRPGDYQLTITATNAHGTGPPKTMRLTVLP
jgi:hypothetical protein